MFKNKIYLEEIVKDILEKLTINKYYGKIIIELDICESNIAKKYTINNETKCLK